VRGRLALTPALSPPPSAVVLRRTGGERENFRALFENSMASVASVALLPFRPEGAPTPRRGGFHKRGERLSLSLGERARLRRGGYGGQAGVRASV